MYVPTMGMNSATTPWNRASAAAPGTSRSRSTTKNNPPLIAVSSSFE